MELSVKISVRAIKVFNIKRLGHNNAVLNALLSWKHGDT